MTVFSSPFSKYPHNHVANTVPPEPHHFTKVFYPTFVLSVSLDDSTKKSIWTAFRGWLETLSILRPNLTLITFYCFTSISLVFLAIIDRISFKIGTHEVLVIEHKAQFLKTPLDASFV